MHVPTWVDPRISALARDQFGAGAEAQGRWDLAYNVTDEDVWALRREMRVSLVEDVRRRLRAAWKKNGPPTPSWRGRTPSWIRTS